MNEKSLPGKGKPSSVARKVTYYAVGSAFSSWNTLFDQAAEFASALGPERLINISHSASGGEGLVVVWYWEK